MSQSVPLLGRLSTLFDDALRRAYPAVGKNLKSMVTLGKNADYQCNSAMPLAMAQSLPAESVAKAIVAALDHGDIIAQTTVTKGFIDVTLRDEYLLTQVATVASSGLPAPKPDKQLDVLVDFASPNMAKELHVGHLRSAVLGDTLARLGEFLGHRVERVSHVGDFGTPMGMVVRECLDRGEDLTPTPLFEPIYLSNLYTSAKKRFNSDAAFASAVGATTLSIQRGRDQDDVRRAYDKICASSRAHHRAMWALLNVNVTERGESFYAPMLSDVVTHLMDKQLATLSNDAKAVFLEGHKDPLLVQKQDSTYLYATTDLAAIKHRTAKNLVIYVTDMGQRTHFAQVFKAAQLAGFYDPVKTQLRHVYFGLVRGEDNKKISSRDSKAPPTLKQLVEDAQDAAKRAVLANRGAEKKPEGDGGDQDALDRLAKAVGLGALRFYDLAHKQDYIFSLNKLVSFKGNSSVYVLYAYVRLANVLSKLPTRPASFTPGGKFYNDAERKLALAICHQPDVYSFTSLLFIVQCSTQAILSAWNNCAPSVLTEATLNLATRAHKFYNDCRILDAPSEEREHRLMLAAAAVNTLGTSLTLLGVPLVKEL